MPSKKYKTVDEAAWHAAKKFKMQGPQYDISTPDENLFGYAVKLNKAKGSPKTHRDGIGPAPKKSTPSKPKAAKPTATKPKTTKPSTSTKGIGRLKRNSYST
jgi:hypothetical protein